MFFNLIVLYYFSMKMMKICFAVYLIKLFIQTVVNNFFKLLKLVNLKARNPKSAPVVTKNRRSSKRSVLELMMSNLEEGRAEDARNTSIINSAIPSQNDLMAAMALVRGKRK